MNIYPSLAVIGDLPDGVAGPADNGTDHIARYENTERQLRSGKHRWRGWGSTHRADQRPFAR